MTAKQAALTKYEAATKLRFHKNTPENFKAVFPTVESLAQFRKEVGGFSWPSSYGQSPWEDSFSVAFSVTEGSFTPSSSSFWERQVTEKTPTPADVCFLKTIAAYGFQLSPTLAEAIR